MENSNEIKESSRIVGEMARLNQEPTISAMQLQILVNRKVAAVANYIAEINTRTDYCAFFEISGHVGWMEVKVSKSKTSFNEGVMDKIKIAYHNLDRSSLNELENALFLANVIAQIDSLILKLEKFFPEGTYDQPKKD